MNGFADAVSGDVEAPTGHFYVVDNFIVTTDNQGFTSMETFINEAAANLEFEQREGDYHEWANDDREV